MRHRRVGVMLTVLLSMALVGVATASPYRHKVNPKVEVWLNSPTLRARTVGVENADKTTAPVLIRFEHPPGQETLRRLRAMGVAFLPADQGDGLMHLGPFYPADVGRAGLRALASAPEVRQVDLDVVLSRTKPLDLTAKDVQAISVWPRQVKGVPLTGKGMLIGNIDTGVDLFHPAFFRADGKLYNWLDLDGDGAFKPGVDAVDLDGDGKAGSGEKLQLLEGVVYDVYKGGVILNSRDGAYDLDQDWLFADTNGDGVRDQGASAGFTDATPVLGEPLFVAEDLDGDGSLDPEEKLRALKTNKVKAVRNKGVVYTRGKDLSTSVSANKSTRTYHGTGTTGVLVGGQRRYHKWVGLTPDAEVLMGTDKSSGSAASSLSAGIIWQAKTPVHVMLHEYSEWSGEHLDGSSNAESLLDQATQIGIPQVVPAGNLGGSNKSMQVTVKAGETRSVTIKYPGGYGGGYVNYYLQVTMLWRSPSVNLEITLTDADGTAVKLGGSNSTGKAWGASTNNITYYDYRYDSSRGTAMTYAALLGGTTLNPKALPKGTWTVSIKNPGAAPVDVLGYVGDAIGGWTSGVSFSSDATEKHLVVWPATADSAITVCAYAGHVGSPYEYQVTGDKSGDLRKYSGRGKRIDGKSIVNVCAPDNPVVPSDASTGVTGLGTHRVFGGTSGAGPHVAAAAVLVLQHNPALKPAAVLSALEKGALSDTQTGAVPSDTWGSGKVRIHRAIFGKDPDANTAPTVKIVHAKKVHVGAKVTFTADVKDAEDSNNALKARWDREYDGTWDTPLGLPAPLTLTFSKLGVHRVKLMVQDSGGMITEAASMVTVVSKDADLGGAADLGDGGVAADTGSSDGEEEDDDGCGCRVAGDEPPWALVGLLFLVALLRRRP